MTPLRIFISSVQAEFAQERAVLRDYLHSDPMMRRFFEVFLFEDVPALDRRPDELYLDEVEHCDLYVGLFGSDYGTEDEEGLSPTEREFDRASEVGTHRLIFVKGAETYARHPKMRALIGKAQAGLIRKRFNTSEELVTGLYAALVEYLEAKELIRWGPFDAAPCAKAVLDDLDFERMVRFIRTARRVRQFPLTEDAPPEELLEHLNLLNNGRLTNAAVLLSGNPLLAESMYLAEYIERMGTGTLDMIRRCVNAGLPEPEFAVSGGFVTTVRRAALAGQPDQDTGRRPRPTRTPATIRCSES